MNFYHYIHPLNFFNRTLPSSNQAHQEGLATMIEMGHLPLEHIDDDLVLKMVKRKCPQSLKFLLSYGGNPNACDEEGVTALMKAAWNGNLQMVQDLIEAGAQLTDRDHFGYNALCHALEKSEHSDMVTFLGRDTSACEDAKELLRRVFLAHVWGLRGSSVLIDSTGEGVLFPLEGLHPFYAMKKLCKYVKDFFQSNTYVNGVMTEAEKTAIQIALEQSYPLTSIRYSTLFAKIRIGEPAVILGGSKGHSVSMLIYKHKQEGYRLGVCNRGLGSDEQTTEFYALPERLITEKMIKHLKKTHQDIESFKEMLVNLKLKYLNGFTQKRQKAGNCTWVASKGACGMLCVAYKGQKIGLEIYKRFTLEGAREKSLIEYFEESPQKDRGILRKIKWKCDNKSRLFLSEKVFKELREFVEA